MTPANGHGERALPDAPPAQPSHRREPRVGRPRFRFRRRRRQLPPVSVFPTLCTFGNLIAGFSAIHFAAKPLGATGIWEWSGLTLAAVLVFVGMVFDAVDGSIARLTRSTSEVGAQLDSLADVVTFGVAPAFMTAMLVGHYLGGAGDVRIIGPVADNMFGRIVWGLAAVYICCAALRLARFNVETPTAAAEDHMSFRGLPSPGAAGAVAGLILLHQHLTLVRLEEVPASVVRGSALGIPFIMALCAFAMVSSMPYAHVINRYLRGRRSFRYIAWLIIPLLFVIWLFPLQITIAVAFCAYALSAPVQQLWQRARRTGALAKNADS